MVTTMWSWGGKMQRLVVNRAWYMWTCLRYMSSMVNMKITAKRWKQRQFLYWWQIMWWWKNVAMSKP